MIAWQSRHFRCACRSRWTRTLASSVLSAVHTHNASQRRFLLVLGAGLLCLGILPAARARATEPNVTMKAPDGAAIDAATKAATEQKVQSLAQELARVAHDHGSDSVALQASLLLETMRAGAVGPSEVRVAGVSPREGAEFLEIAVGTGLIFDSDTTDLATCSQRVWASVAAPVLSRMERFDLRPGGLELVFTYGLQSFSRLDDREADPAEPHEPHTVRFVLPASVLDDLAVHRITIDAALAAARSAIDDVVAPAAKVTTPPAP